MNDQTKSQGGGNQKPDPKPAGGAKPAQPASPGDARQKERDKSIGVGPGTSGSGTASQK